MSANLRSLYHPELPSDVSRRRFLQGALALGGAAALGPSVFADAAGALGANDRILICVYMAGGNDGLNTIAPLDNGAYFDARGPLALDATTAHRIAANRYLHPNLPGLAQRYQNGKVAIVEGVGHPDDDHSHFSSVATWMSASAARGPAMTGWLGRYLEGSSLGLLGGVNIGDNGVPLHMVGRSTRATGLPTGGSLFGANADEVWEQEMLSVMTDIGAGTGLSPMADIYGAQLSAAIETANVVSPMYTDDELPYGLVRDLTLAARLINLDVGARVIGVDFGSFDNHDDQPDAHAESLAEFDAGISAFFATLNNRFANRVTVMTFSEFGRRVEANDSRGTDHGTAGPMMLIGNSVNGGFHGEHPSLTRLDERGDLKHSVDFRSVYASVLSSWLRADDAEVLGGSFEHLDLFGTPGSGTTTGQTGSRVGGIGGNRKPRTAGEVPSVRSKPRAANDLSASQAVADMGTAVEKTLQRF